MAQEYYTGAGRYSPAEFDTQVVACGSPLHLADLAELKARGLPIPHDYSSWPLCCAVGSWAWCRITGLDGELLTGFSVHLTNSRAIPGTRIGQIERLGRSLHEPVADEMGSILAEVARKIPRLLRLDARIFDEDPARRKRLSDSLHGAGCKADIRRRQYSHTVILTLAAHESEVLARFSPRVRSTIRKVLASPALYFQPVPASGYIDRIRQLYNLTFERTGGMPPPLDIEGIVRDSSSGESSLLVGAFARGSEPPEDLIALAWGRLHGDYSVLELNASARSPLLRRLSPGFGLMMHLIQWTIERGGRWIDLGGLSTITPAADDPMQGIVEFKTRFSTDFREVAEEWHLDPSPMLTAAASVARSIARSVSDIYRV